MEEPSLFQIEHGNRIDKINLKQYDMVKPTFIGIGGHKCASTWLSECLRYHPEVFMSSPKEIHFYSYDSDHDIEWYLNHFKDAENYKVRGEFSATYLQYPKVAENIFNTVGAVKIIVSLRDPVDRFISHYKHLYRLGDVVYEKLDMEKLDEVTDKHPELLERGNYSRYLKEFIDIFGRENICIIVKDDIDCQPNEVLRKMYDFLGVQSDFIPPILEKKVSPGIIPKVYFLEYLRVNVYGLLKKSAPAVLNLIRKTRVTELYRKLNNKKNALGITDEVRKRLKVFYEKDISDLELILNRELDWRKHSYGDKVLD